MTHETDILGTICMGLLGVLFLLGLPILIPVAILCVPVYFLGKFVLHITDNWG